MNQVIDSEDDDSANLEEILKELNQERAKNRDLNQTISDILERMEHMERDITVNQLKMEDNILSMAEGVERNSANIIEVFEDVSAVQDDVVILADFVSSSDQLQASQIKSLGTRGTWCGYKYGPWTSVGTIRYDQLTFADSNMEVNGTPLDINTGN